MTTAKAVLAHGLIFGLAVILTGATAQAGHYGHIDNHSRDIEREAERAEAIVKYNFRHAPAPIVQYLCESLNGVAQTSHQLHELSECSGNVLAIETITSQLDAQVCDVRQGIVVLREWVEGCSCSVRRFSSCFSSCRPRSIDRANLSSLLRRTDEIDEELCEMKKDLQIALTEHHRTHSHSSSFSRGMAPAIPQARIAPSRYVIPLGTYERPGHNFSRSTHSSRGLDSRRGTANSHNHGSSHDQHGVSPGSRSGHGRHSDSSYIQTRIGGFGLSFQLR
ncbi:MAG: hypothetical protein HQ518_13755 [Rhodopirellula sp.]|nr:hypothetical protein [Rhodopirellula sp.]